MPARDDECHADRAATTARRIGRLHGSRPGTALALLATAVVLLGATGWVLGGEASARRSMADVRGDFWHATHPDGSPLRARAAPGGGLVLAEGGTLHFDLGHDKPQRLQSFGLELQPLVAPALVELHLAEGPDGAGIVRVVPGQPLLAVAGHRTADGSQEILARRRVTDGPLPLTAFRLRLTLDGSRFLLALNGTEILNWEDPRATGGSCSLLAVGGGLRITHLRATTMGDSGARTLLDDLRSLPALSPVPERIHRAVLVLVSILAAALYLRVSCPVAPRTTCLVAAMMAGLALPALPFVSTVFTGEAAHPPASTCWLLGLAGLIMGVAFVRPRARDAQATPTPTNPRRVLWLALGILAACGTLAAIRQGEVLAPRLEAERRSLDAPTPARFSLDAPRTLDATSALVAAGNWRDLTLEGRVRLSEGAVLELRLRTRDEEAVALCLSARPDLPTRWMLQAPMRHQPVGTSAAAVSADTWINLSVTVEGRQAQATVDGEALTFGGVVGAGGEVVVLAAAGHVDVETLHVTPISTTAPFGKYDPWRGAALWRAAGAPALALLAWLAVTVLALRRRPWRLAAAGAFALLPLTALLAEGCRDGHASLAALVHVILAGGLLFTLPTVLASRRPWLAIPGAILVGLGASMLACLGTVTMRVEPDATPPAVTTLLAWHGERVRPGLAHWQVPRLRHLNGALSDHRFRGQQVPARAPDVFRVLALGGSVTWGFHIPAQPDRAFPAVLQELLEADRSANANASGNTPRSSQVLNAAWRGATGARLLLTARDALADVDIDVVLLCLTYNDAFANTRGNEHAMLTALQGQGSASPSPADRLTGLFDGLLLSLRYARGDADLSRLLHAAREAPPDHTTRQLWQQLGLQAGQPDPPERFAAMLEAFVSLTKERGQKLVLVLEPMADDGPVIWKDEFRDVLRDLAQRHHLPLVDPTPALQAAGGGALFLDRVHPNIDGHACIARELLPVVRALRDGP